MLLAGSRLRARRAAASVPALADRAASDAARCRLWLTETPSSRALAGLAEAQERLDFCRGRTTRSGAVIEPRRDPRRDLTRGSRGAGRASANIGRTLHR